MGQTICGGLHSLIIFTSLRVLTLLQGAAGSTFLCGTTTAMAVRSFAAECRALQSRPKATIRPPISRRAIQQIHARILQQNLASSGSLRHVLAAVYLDGVQKSHA